MSIAKHLLGKVFISYSSLDKPFVRRLSTSIKKAGFQVWLDEHELVVGDPLGERIAEALKTANVVLVVITHNSINSKWLRFELNLATERMVKGECRVIPVVVEDAPLPPEVIGLLYADFKSTFKVGIKSILTSLAFEASRFASKRGFWAECEDIVSFIFGGAGFVSIDGQYKSIDYNTVSIPVATDDDSETTVVYDVISSHSRPPSPLTETWWDEYTTVTEDYGEFFFLVVTERPIGFDVLSRTGSPDEISFRSYRIGRHSQSFVVFTDLSRTRSRKKRQDILQSARTLLIELATNEKRSGR
jgi:hypothetical protein